MQLRRFVRASARIRNAIHRLPQKARIVAHSSAPATQAGFALMLAPQGGSPMHVPAVMPLLWCLAAALGSGLCAGVQAQSQAPADGAAYRALELDHHILVDQFGYRPNDPKVAVIRSPQVGFDSNDAFVLGTPYELRRAGDGVLVFAGAPVEWEGGMVEVSSGDKGWWFDFSRVKTPGRYMIVDAERNRR